MLSSYGLLKVPFLPQSSWKYWLWNVTSILCSLFGGQPKHYLPCHFTHDIRLFVLSLMCLLDRLMYGSWVLVPLNFLKFNFLSSGGDYYGTHKWHWYFTQGFTVMMFTFLPFSVAGLMQSKQWILSGLISWVLVIYSVLGHKEFRYPLLNSLIFFCIWCYLSRSKIWFWLILIHSLIRLWATGLTSLFFLYLWCSLGTH